MLCCFPAYARPQATFPQEVASVNFKDARDGRPPVAWVPAPSPARSEARPPAPAVRALGVATAIVGGGQHHRTAIPIWTQRTCAEARFDVGCGSQDCRGIS